MIAGLALLAPAASGAKPPEDKQDKGKSAEKQPAPPQSQTDEASAPEEPAPEPAAEPEPEGELHEGFSEEGERVELDERAEPAPERGRSSGVRRGDERNKRQRAIERLRQLQERARSAGKSKAARQRVIQKLIAKSSPGPEPESEPEEPPPPPPPLVVDSFTYEKLAFTVNAPGSMSVSPIYTGFTRQFTVAGANKYTAAVSVTVDLYYNFVGSSYVYQLSLTMNPSASGSQAIYFPVEIVVQQVDLNASAY